VTAPVPGPAVAFYRTGLGRDSALTCGRCGSVYHDLGAAREHADDHRLRSRGEFPVEPVE
jgi:hypothetical protein